MNKIDAQEIVDRHRDGKPVVASALQSAVYALASKREQRFRLPELPRPVKEQTNMVLMFNLGRALRCTAS